MAVDQYDKESDEELDGGQVNQPMLEDNSSIVVEKSPAQAAPSYQNDEYCHFVPEGSPQEPL